MSVIREIYEACQPSKRDMANGPGFKYNRFLAAKFLLELAEDKIEPAKLNLYLDRTEGKVVDVICQRIVQRHGSSFRGWADSGFCSFEHLSKRLKKRSSHHNLKWSVMQ